MNKEDKSLLLKDLCARLPYNVIINCTDSDTDYKCFLTTDIVNELLHDIEYYNYKPYLRSMSSMTEEERDEIEEISHGWFWINEDGEIFPMGRFTDSGEFEDAILPTFKYFLEKHFDFMGLIPKDLAIAVTEENNPYKN